ncbi:hypothetical protein [Streptomyces sp. MP131-18]|uniref:hypothetical protein n=1 Tax=Streptomyces sp. MP131-18 TaxID=1857892 RepID=UPI00097BFB27|nr:hypothetical protein [Streptomyces sp. MP131-18]ONK12640.1 hypothetical protein STBA_33880 [Streptomyces sp. MP131-18]
MNAARAGTGCLRLLRHERALWSCLLRRLFRRGPHGVGPGDTAAGYASAQAALNWVMLFLSVLETVVLAVLVPWPLVHAVLLVIGLWGIFFVVAHQSACVVRPHVVGADGSLRIRHGALVDIRVPADRIAAARVDTHYTGGGPLRVHDEPGGPGGPGGSGGPGGPGGPGGSGGPGGGTAVLAVAGQVSVTVELTAPVPFLRPLGRPARARVLRFWADDARALVAALDRSAAAADPRG